MIINRWTDGNFYGSQFDISTTDLVEYFPVYITFERERYDNYYYSNAENNAHNFLSEYITNDVYLYRKPERLSLSNNNTSLYDTYDRLFDSLKNRLRNVKYLFTYNGENHYLNVIKGYIADNNNNILLLLTTKDFVIFNRDGSLKKDSLRLYVSTEFLKNEIYTNLYKRLLKDYINEFYTEDIEVVFTTSEKIEKACYKNHFNVEFDNITQLNTILEVEPNEILNYVFEEEDERVPNNIESDVVEEEPLPF